MKIAIVGTGTQSEFHISYAKEIKEIDLVAVCDVDRGRADEVARRFGIPRVYYDLTKMLEDSSPDAVHIVTPPKYHADLAIEALNKGCHVLIEKPMALTVEDAEKIVSTSKAKNVNVSVCHNVLFEPVVLRAKELVESGELGDLICAETYWLHELGDSAAYAFKGTNTGWAYDLPGSVFGNFIDHAVYLQREFLKNVDICSVVTDRLGSNPFIPYDELRIQLTGTKSFGLIVASLNIRPSLNLLRLYGTKAIINVGISNATLTTQARTNIPIMFAKALNNFRQSYQLATDTISTSTRILSGRIKPRQGLRTLINQFYSSLLSGDPPPISATDGLEAVSILSQIWKKTESSIDTSRGASGHKPVSFSPTLQEPDKVSTVAASKQIRRPIALVSGANGFLGSHLVDKLPEKDFKVRVLIRRINRKFVENPNIEIVYGDIRDENAIKKSLQGVDIVYHCAGMTTNRGKWEDFQKATIDATQNLLNLSRNAGVKRFVYVSSVVIYGFQKIDGRNTITENDPYGNNLGRYYYYARSKIEADKLVLDYFRNYRFPVSIIRPGILYGPRGKNIFKNKKFVIGQAKKVLPYTYVENVIDALILAGTKREAIGQAYNIVDDEQLSQKEFMNRVCRVSNSKKRGIFFPMPITYLAALLFEYLASRRKSDSSPPISMYTIDTIRRNLIYDTTKARQQLGWRPKISLEEGLERAFQSFQDRGGLD